MSREEKQRRKSVSLSTYTFFFFNLPPLILKKIQVCLVSFKTSHVVRGSKLWSQIYKLMLNRISHFDGIFYCICIEEIRSTKDLCL